MTSEPQAPGAPAIILYRQVDRDDSGRVSHEENYFRIKIFTEEGRKYANIEIPFLKGREEIAGVHARTIKPDGTIADFDGQVYEKWIVKAKGLRYLVKTFTLPNVQPGGIIEYFYTLDLDEFIYNSHWILSQELFTRRAQFSLRQYENAYITMHLRWTWQHLPPGSTQPKEGADKVVHMEASNIPAFQTEDYMPPENELKARVDFFYETGPMDADPAEYWKRVGKLWNAVIESYVDKHKAMEHAVSQIVSPNDAPEVKLRKIYDRVQQLRNTSYEPSKTRQEEKRNKEKVAKNVEDVWKHGYGNGAELTWLYLALVRAAGFGAYGCLVSDRRDYFLNPKLEQSSKLNANVVLVKINGKNLYLDPGGASTPFGMLSWDLTGTPGLRLDEDGGVWITTTLPQAAETQILFRANLTLSEEGDLEGKLALTWTGLAAIDHRRELRNSDDVARKKYLEDYTREQIPTAAEVELTNKPNWNSSGMPLVAEFDLKIRGWSSAAGKRALFPVGIFTAAERNTFEHANRVHPIYINYPYQKVDDITVQLPPGWQVNSMPSAQMVDSHSVIYEAKFEKNMQTLHLSRKFTLDFILLEQKYYGALRNFFQTMRTGDEEQVVLQPGAALSAR